MNKFKTIKNVCPYCHKTNLMQAKYCAYCGEDISKTQKEAYKTTVFGQISYLKDKKGKVDKYVGYVKDPEKIITSNRKVKIALIAIFMALGIYMGVTNKPLWKQLSIVSNEDYKAKYSNNEFVLDTDKDMVTLKIACTGTVKKATVANDKEDNVVCQYGNKSEVKIIKNTKYTLTVTYEDDTSESINFRFE